MISIAIAGKPNVGKSTFFKAATLIDVPISNRPFTTIDANIGVAGVRTKCICSQLLKNPCGNCIDGIRFIPLKLIDVAGLVPGAHRGRGLGNQFLDHLSKADGMILVVDAAGSTDPDGNPVAPGEYDPVEEVGNFIQEFDLWMLGILKRDWKSIIRKVQSGSGNLPQLIAQRLAGLRIDQNQVIQALPKLGDLQDESSLLRFVDELRKIRMPMVIAANKIDIADPGNLEALSKLGYPMVPVCAEAELILRMASSKKLIRYVPGDPEFEIIEPGKLNQAQYQTLNRIRELMQRSGGTGVQQCLNELVFKSMNKIVVYPVEDEDRYCDSKGRLLPDALLMDRGSNPRDLGYVIHTDLGQRFIKAIDAKTKKVLSSDYQLQDGDVIKIFFRR